MGLAKVLGDGEVYCPLPGATAVVDPSPRGRRAQAWVREPRCREMTGTAASRRSSKAATGVAAWA